MLLEIRPQMKIEISDRDNCLCSQVETTVRLIESDANEKKKRPKNRKLEKESNFPFRANARKFKAKFTKCIFFFLRQEQANKRVFLFFVSPKKGASSCAVKFAQKLTRSQLHSFAKGCDRCFTADFCLPCQTNMPFSCCCC
jgi:hypothetical protein